MGDNKAAFITMKGGAESSYDPVGRGENASLYGGGVRFGARAAPEGNGLLFVERALSIDYYSDGEKMKVVNLGWDMTFPFLFFLDGIAGVKAELEDASDKKLRWRATPLLGLSATIPLIWNEKDPIPQWALDARMEAGLMGFNGNGLIDSFTGVSTTLGLKWFF